tara:strand:- start:2511 stop:3488 length:978 start_codon:yes stop_codon:yes gene_type:complete
MGGDAAGGDNSGDSARGTQAQRGRNNAGLGSGGETTSQVDSFRAFSAPPAQQPTGFDAGRGPSVTGAGNGTLGTSTSSITNIIDLDPLASLAKVAPPTTVLGKPVDLTTPLNSPRSSLARQAALAGKSALLGTLGLPGSGSLTEEEQARVDAQAKGLNKAEELVGDTGGARVTPATEGLLGLKSKGIGIKGGRPGVVSKTKVGFATMVGAATPIPFAVAAGRAIDVNTDYALGSKTFDGFTPTDGKSSGTSPFGDDGGGSDGGGSSPNIRRRVNAPTPQAAGSTAAQPQNLSFLQRLERQRGRAASSSTGASGQGRYASRTLLGT